MTERTNAARYRGKGIVKALIAVAAVALVTFGLASPAQANVGPFWWANQATNLCITAVGGTTANYTRVDEASCNGSSYQEWWTPDVGSQQWFYSPILYNGQKQCITLTSSGADPVLLQCGQFSGQNWYRLRTPDGRNYYFKNARYGTCLTEREGLTSFSCNTSDPDDRFY